MPRRAVRRVAAAVQRVGADARRRRQALREQLARLPAPTTTSTSTRSTRSPTGRSRTCASRSRSTSPTGARSERTQYTKNVADGARRGRHAGHEPVDPDRAAGLQAQRDGPRRRRQPTPSTCSRSRRIWSALEQRTGRTVTLAIEPEPYCFLETTDETVAFFERAPLHAAPARERLAQLAGPRGLRRADRAAPPRRHRVRHLPPGARVRGHPDVARARSSTPASRSSSSRRRPRSRCRRSPTRRSRCCAATPTPST